MDYYPAHFNNLGKRDKNICKRVLTLIQILCILGM
jgi:hypothetical protein